MFEGLIGQMPPDAATRMKLMELAEKRAMLYATLGMFNTKLAAAFRSGDEGELADAWEYYTTNKIDERKEEIEDLRHDLVQKGVFDGKKFNEMLPMAGLALLRAFDLNTFFAATETSPERVKDILDTLRSLRVR